MKRVQQVYSYVVSVNDPSHSIKGLRDRHKGFKIESMTSSSTGTGKVIVTILYSYDADDCETTETKDCYRAVRLFLSTFADWEAPEINIHLIKSVLGETSESEKLCYDLINVWNNDIISLLMNVPMDTLKKFVDYSNNQSVLVRVPKND